MSKTGCSASYDRVPSEPLQQLLAPEGFLAPLLRKRKVEGIGLEAHLRPKNEIHVYCGLTCLVKTRLSGSGDIWVESHKTYANKPPANRLFRPGRTRAVNRGAYARDVWAVGEPGFAQALETFLDGVPVDVRQRNRLCKNRPRALLARFSLTSRISKLNKINILSEGTLEELTEHSSVSGIFRRLYTAWTRSGHVMFP